MAKDKSSTRKPKVNQELDGFEIKIDTFGEITSNLSIDDLNKFLNRHVDDKKLRNRNDLDSSE